MKSLSDFPEDSFLPHPRRAVEYAATVYRGTEIAARQRVVITALARDVSDTLPATVARVERTGSMFRDYRVVVFENDSADSTAKQLRVWAKANKRVTAVCESLGDPKNASVRCLQRAGRMAHYRNLCRDLILDKYPDWDNVIIVETDIEDGWSYDGILNTFGQSTEWHAVGANGILYRPYRNEINRPLQYDVWAWRWPDSWKAQDNSKVNPRFWPRGEPLVPLNSCFGGLGIYKMEAMAAARYDGSDCEHVPFHHSMKAAGFTGVFMNPSQIVLYNHPT